MGAKIYTLILNIVQIYRSYITGHSRLTTLGALYTVSLHNRIRPHSKYLVGSSTCSAHRTTSFLRFGITHCAISPRLKWLTS